MFFEVKAKCGHVGRNKYVLKDFYVEADSAKEAALNVRNMPRVKHHQKDAIREVMKITEEEYKEGKIKNKQDEYFNVHNSSDQKRIVMENICYEEKEEKEKTKDLYYKLIKKKLINRETKRMLLGVYYG